VRNNNKLSVILKFFQEFNEPPHIGVVEGSVHFVKNTEWTGFDEIDREEERKRGQGFFASAELFDRERLFASGFRYDFDMRFERVFGAADEQIDFVFRIEKLMEDSDEVFSYRGIGFPEFPERGFVNFLNSAAQLVFRREQVCFLGQEEIEPLFFRFVFFEREFIDRSELLPLFLKGFETFFLLRPVKFAGQFRWVDGIEIAVMADLDRGQKMIEQLFRADLFILKFRNQFPADIVFSAQFSLCVTGFMIACLQFAADCFQCFLRFLFFCGSYEMLFQSFFSSADVRSVSPMLVRVSSALRSSFLISS